MNVCQIYVCFKFLKCSSTIELHYSSALHSLGKALLCGSPDVGMAFMAKEEK